MKGYLVAVDTGQSALHTHCTSQSIWSVGDAGYIVSLRFKLKISKKMLMTDSEASYIIIKTTVAICPATGLKKN